MSAAAGAMGRWTLVVDVSPLLSVAFEDDLVRECADDAVVLDHEAAAGARARRRPCGHGCCDAKGPSRTARRVPQCRHRDRSRIPEKFTVCPMSTWVPSAGALIVALGGRLPTVIVVVIEDDRPPLSVDGQPRCERPDGGRGVGVRRVRRGGRRSVAEVPQVSSAACPPGSIEPALENATVSGEYPLRRRRARDRHGPVESDPAELPGRERQVVDHPVRTEFQRDRRVHAGRERDRARGVAARIEGDALDEVARVVSEEDSCPDTAPGRATRYRTVHR